MPSPLARRIDRTRGARAALAAALALAACTVGPDYQRPAVVVPERWKEAAPSDEALRGDWWAIFRDPPLDALVNKARAANQTLAQAVARVTAAEANLRAAGADRWPSAVAAPSATRHRIYSGEVGGKDDTVNRSLFIVPFNLSYEIDLWGRVRRTVEAAGAAYEASRADMEVVRLGVAADVAQAWFALRHADLDRAILREAVELRRQTLALVESRLRNGAASELDTARARAELAQAESDAAAIERTRALIEHALAQLTGEPAPAVTIPEQALAVAVPAVPVRLPSELLERRPDVARAERQMAAANARIGIAAAAYYPTINLAALVGFQSIEIDQLFRWDNRIWSIGAAATAPIFLGGLNDARLDLARAQHEEALAAYRQQVLVAFQEVEDALAGLRALARQQEAQDRLVEASDRAAALARARYTQGLSNQLDVIDAQRTLLLARRGANQIHRDQLLTSVLLMRALGGGWKAQAE
jgi:multidrug efflux system outer membrane protein